MMTHTAGPSVRAENQISPIIVVRACLDLSLIVCDPTGQGTKLNKTTAAGCYIREIKHV